MTQYLLAVRFDYGAPELPPAEIERAYTAVDAFNRTLMDSGRWVFAGGLQEPETASVVRADPDEVATTDGPYIEGKEHIGGFWVITADDLDEALDWAARATQACLQPVEVRPFVHAEASEPDPRG